jgi:hypothetical protein
MKSNKPLDERRRGCRTAGMFGTKVWILWIMSVIEPCVVVTRIRVTRGVDDVLQTLTSLIAGRCRGFGRRDGEGWNLRKWYMKCVDPVVIHDTHGFHFNGSYSIVEAGPMRR